MARALLGSLLLGHAAAAQTVEEPLFLMVSQARSGTDWLIDLLDAHPHVCIPAGAWPEKHSGDKHNGVDGHALIGEKNANELIQRHGDVADGSAAAA